MPPRRPQLPSAASIGAAAGEPPGESAGTVGYGRPPVRTRFKPGQSGNPRGRPRGARNTMPALNEERLKTIILAEAYRTIKVNDGARQVSVPMAQAVVRSLAVNAVKGQHRAQRLFSELLSATERDNKALNDEWLKTALEYKQGWEAAIQRCQRLGLPAPDPVPHPDHIDLDMQTGQIVVDGPMTCDQRETGRQLIARLMDSGAELARSTKARASRVLHGDANVGRGARGGDAHDHVAGADAARIEIAPRLFLVVLRAFLGRGERGGSAGDDPLHHRWVRAEGRRAFGCVEDAEPA